MSRHGFFRVAAIVASVGAVSFGAVVATASSASAWLFDDCPAVDASTPFAAWGDSNSYVPMPDGGFEAGGAGWDVSGATVESPNESYFVNSPTDTQSLSVPDGAQASSPAMCVGMGEYTIRMFVKSSGGPDSVLHVQARVENDLTGLVLSTGHDLTGGSETDGWSATDQLIIPNLLGGLLGTQHLTLVFTTSGAPATWNVDDVYVDPFRSH